MRITTLRAVLVVMVLALPAVATIRIEANSRLSQTSQSPQIDSRWLPWIGCWQSTVDHAARANDTRVCVVPAAASGVRLLTIAGDQTRLEELLVPDGTDHPLQDPQCSGVRRAEWSKNGRMIFTVGSKTCQGQRPEKISGIFLMTAGPWFDIQVSEAGPQTAVDVQRYGRIEPPPSIAALLPDAAIGDAEAAARRLTDISLSIADVVEASTRVSSRAIEAVLYETSARFEINKRALTTMDDAGVDEEVIDLMLALSFPERFAVDRPTASNAPGGSGYMGWAAPEYPGYGYGQWGWSRPYYAWDSRRVSRGFGPFGLGYYDYLGRTDGSQRGHSGDAPGGATTDATPRGAVVAGQGYTRVRPTDPPPTTAVSTNGPRPTSSSSSGDSGSSSGSSGQGSSSSAGASASGYSSGGSGGSGRTAVERE